jgi:glucans biosynthesis protein C
MSKAFIRTSWIDNLRSFLTLLVVAHHSSLAYTTFAKFDKTNYMSSTAPVVDNSRWIVMDIFESFNDIFFMSLMFLISGLFFYRSIAKKGKRKFFSDRLLRLGLPFVIVVTLIMPLAYYPSFYLAEQRTSFAAFIYDFIFHQHWPAGPLWFIWILLAFNLLAAIIPLHYFTSAHTALMKLAQKPFGFLSFLFVFAAIAYTPLSLIVGQYTWTAIGPFAFQLNRILLYFLFFLFGCCFGASDWEDQFFTGTKMLNQSAARWVVLSMVCYFIFGFYALLAQDLVKTGKMDRETADFIFSLLFVGSCIASSLAFIAVFRKRINASGKWWKSLSANAYGIYLVHYIFVTWIQFVLLNLPVPVIVKFALVFLGALLLSWLIIQQFRKTVWVNRLIG